MSGLGELPFDASVAIVDDFRVGENVEVVLEPSGASLDIVAVRPLDWRAPKGPEPLALDLDAVRAAIGGHDLTMRALDDERSLWLWIGAGGYDSHRHLVFEGCAFAQLPATLEKVATLNAFALEDFARETSDLASHWPALAPQLTVFRLEPRAFRAAVGYVVAMRVRLDAPANGEGGA